MFVGVIIAELSDYSLCLLTLLQIYPSSLAFGIGLTIFLGSPSNLRCLSQPFTRFLPPLLFRPISKLVKLRFNHRSSHFGDNHETNPIQHFRLHSRGAPFITLSSRSAFRTAEANRTDDTAVDFGFETIVGASIRVKTSCRPLLHPMTRIKKIDGKMLS